MKFGNVLFLKTSYFNVEYFVLIAEFINIKQVIFIVHHVTRKVRYTIFVSIVME